VAQSLGTTFYQLIVSEGQHPFLFGDLAMSEWAKPQCELIEGTNLRAPIFHDRGKGMGWRYLAQLSPQPQLSLKLVELERKGLQAEEEVYSNSMQHAQINSEPIVDHHTP